MIHFRIAASEIAVLALCVTSATIVYLWPLRDRSIRTATLQNRLQIRRVEPPGEVDDLIQCESNEKILLTYELINRSNTAIVGLKPSAACSCELNGSVPKHIPPNGSARLSIRVRTPLAGIVRREMPITFEGSADQTAKLVANLHVKFNPPALLTPPTDRQLTFIEDEFSASEVVLDSLEARENPRWIVGIQFDPPSSLKLQSERIEEFPESDPKLIRRRYRFTVANHSLKLGRHVVSALLNCDSTLSPAPPPVPLHVVIMDSLAIIPNPLVIRGGQDGVLGQQVRIISRGRLELTPIAVNFNRELLNVSPTDHQGKAATFEVLQVGAPGKLSETEVAFNVGDREKVLRVQLDRTIKP